MFELPIVIVKKSDTAHSYEELLDGFTNKQFCDGGVAALQFLEQNPPALVIIEAETDDMDGIEIAEAIREIDEEDGRFTYIVIFGGPSDPALKRSFNKQVDAYVTSELADSLSAVASAGCRLSFELSYLKKTNIELTLRNHELEKGQLLDPLTGLGNRKYAEQSLKDSIRQIESRGGAVCFLLISVQNFDDTKLNYNTKIADDLIVSISEKILHLVRPLDIVAYFSPGQFALVLMQPSIEHCTAECYQRIYDGVRLKSYKTAAGFLPANIAMSICASHAENGPPNVNTLVNMAQQNLTKAHQQDAIYVHHLTPVEA